MSIFVDETSRVLVQGLTGAEGTKHTRRMVAAGSNIVGGVTPGKAGQTMDGIPVFGSVADGVAETGADVCVVFVPPKFAKAAVYETIDAGVPLCVIITEGIPVRDSASFWAYSQAKGGTRILGSLTRIHDFRSSPALAGKPGGSAGGSLPLTADAESIYP